MLSVSGEGQLRGRGPQLSGSHFQINEVFADCQGLVSAYVLVLKCDKESSNDRQGALVTTGYFICCLT